MADRWECGDCGWRAPRAEDGTPLLAPDLARMSDGFEADAFEPLAEVETGHFWFEGRNRILVEALARYFPRAERFLEVGCGTGFVLAGVGRANPGLELTGSELLLPGLEIARARVPGAEFVQMDATRIPFRDHFDVVGAFDVLEHIDDDRAVLREIRRALRPGGGVLLTVPQHRWLWSALDSYAHHRRRYSRAELVGKVREAGLQVLRVTSFVTLPLPLMLASRLRIGRTPKAVDPQAEFRIPRAANALLGGMLRLERSLIRSGASLPVGGSLLLVARREEE